MFETLLKQLNYNKFFYMSILLGEKFIQIFPSNVLYQELALAYYWINKHSIEYSKRGIDLINLIEESRHGNENLLLLNVANLKYYLKNIEEFEQSKVINIEYNISLNLNPLITFTITTCNRLELFLKSMRGFLENCLDIHLISRWICIDDNSTESDRKIMKQTFPFVEFIFKNEKDKGHAKSMQMLTELITTPFHIHIEDDRFLLNKRNYINTFLEIMNSDESIGQIAFNHNYAEIIDDCIIGGVLNKTKSNIFYYEHEYCFNDEEKVKFNEKYGIGSTCNYYPHFTLSPSMIRTSIYKTVKFEQEPMFEFNFGLRYVKAGFKTVFLPGFNIKHIGRITRNMHDLLQYNAYDLNDTEQFQKKIIYKSFLINLDRRDDRIQKIQKVTHLLPVFERVSAIDGKKLNISNRLRSLFKHNDFNMRPGVVGCALSHIKLYIQLLQDDVDGYIIFEDDIEPDDMFLKRLKRVFTVLENKHENPDLIYFTITPRYHGYIYPTEGIVKKNTAEDILLEHCGGTGCYYISKNGASHALKYIQENSVNVGIDIILFRLASLINLFVVQPPISYNSNENTDIQNDFHILSHLYEENLTLNDYSSNIIYNNDGTIDKLLIDEILSF